MLRRNKKPTVNMVGSSAAGSGKAREIRLKEREARNYIELADQCQDQEGAHSVEEVKYLNEALKLRKEILELCVMEEKTYYQFRCVELDRRIRTALTELELKKTRNIPLEPSAEYRRKKAEQTQQALEKAAQSPLAETIAGFFQPAPERTLSDYIGHKELVEKLRALFDNRKLKVEEYLGLMHNQLILLYGEPGTGKSYLIECMVGELMARDPEYRFISVKASDIVSKYVGETEKLIAELFKTVESMDKCILLIDEIDQFLERKTGGRESSAHEKRTTSEFQLSCDRILKSKHEIYFFGITNYPEAIEAAMISRFKKFEVPLPDQESRSMIFRKGLQQTALEEDITFEEMGALTEGYSHRDMNNMIESMKRWVKTQAGTKDSSEEEDIRAISEGKVRISRAVFQDACRTYGPLKREG